MTVELLVLLLLGACLGSRQPTENVTPTSASVENGRILGPINAPVTIIEYGDFGCPTCLAWYRAGIIDQVLIDYSGKVRFIWRDFPVITPRSPKAAEAGWCATDQGQFWKYHNLIYANALAIDINSLKKYATQIGLDTQKFDQCLDSGQHRSDVERDLHDATAQGFQATPSFLVNNKPLIGPPSLNQLESIIDPLLANPD